ncbi:hypothetical protein HPG69_003560 [Diceros bicornis minor]|uniref:Uncharacterized protein n=1 Tax=Diceros bicornis minor TaxID=77932 RepID=A0A7J7EH33_DICBM|nr:hypothetical protein HPG69_003560 [Diceros bicornis minor]
MRKYSKKDFPLAMQRNDKLNKRRKIEKYLDWEHQTIWEKVEVLQLLIKNSEENSYHDMWKPEILKCLEWSPVLVPLCDQILNKPYHIILYHVVS